MRAEEARFLALPSQFSLGVVHLQPGSERFLEDTPGNQLQFCQSLYLACRQTQLTSFHSQGVWGHPPPPLVAPPFCVSLEHQTFLFLHVLPVPSLYRAGTSLERKCRIFSCSLLLNSPCITGKPSFKAFLLPLPFSLTCPNFSLEHKWSSP